MKCIVYSLFGHGKPQQGSFSFPSYLRGFMLNVRLKRLLFPDWVIILETDQATYEAYQYLFNNIDIEVRVNKPAPLCLAMLWRMKPIFETNEDQSWKYTHVLCRDTDSPLTYREAQAVQYWINRDKAVHAITDSVSHDVPMLGGMIGARPAYFTELVAQTWEEMIAMGGGFKFDRQGSDQTFLKNVIYPKFSVHGKDSITQHYFKGMPDPYLTDYRTCSCPSIVGHESHCINNIEISVQHEYKESNSICGHIGAAGWYETVMFKFLRKHKDKYSDLLEFEKEYPTIFYWCFDDTFK